MPSLVIGVLISLIMACFAIQNSESVEVDFLFLTFEIPLVLVILMAFLCGVMVATLFLLHTKYKNYQQRKKLNQEKEELEKEISKLQEKNKMLMYNQRLHGSNPSWPGSEDSEQVTETEPENQEKALPSNSEK